MISADSVDQLEATTALFLLPSLLPPTEGIVAGDSADSSASAEGGNDAGGVTASATSVETTWAASRLTAYDNRYADIDIWYSDLQHDERWESDGTTTRYVYTLHVEANPQSVNWFAESADAWFRNSDSTEAEGFGKTRFNGIWFWGPYWEAQVDHRIDLTRDTHENWMSGTFWWEDGISNYRCRWKDKTFYWGGTYYNEIRHRSTWYLLNDNSEFLRSLTGACPA